MAKKSANANDYSTADIDKLFERLDRDTMAKMTGTGHNPSKKKTSAPKTPAKKKVKRK